MAGAGRDGAAQGWTSHLNSRLHGMQSTEEGSSPVLHFRHREARPAGQHSIQQQPGCTQPPAVGCSAGGGAQQQSGAGVKSGVSGCLQQLHGCQGLLLASALHLVGAQHAGAAEACALASAGGMDGRQSSAGRLKPADDPLPSHLQRPQPPIAIRGTSCRLFWVAAHGVGKLVAERPPQPCLPMLLALVGAARAGRRHDSEVGSGQPTTVQLNSRWAR